jgi:Flp pilus assembly protein TadB
MSLIDYLSELKDTTKEKIVLIYLWIVSSIKSGLGGIKSFILFYISNIIKLFQWFYRGYSIGVKVVYNIYNYITTSIYTGYTSSKESTVNGVSYIWSRLKDFRNYIIVKSFSIIKFIYNIITKSLKLLYNIVIYSARSIVRAYKLIVNNTVKAYNIIKLKIYNFGVSIVKGVVILYAYIKLSGVVSSEIVTNIVSAIRSGVINIIESDESVRDKWYAMILSSVDSISYTILKFLLIAAGKQTYNEPLFSATESRFPQIDEWLNQANNPQNAEKYMARSILFIVIAFVIGVIGGGIIGALAAPTITSIELPLLTSNIPTPIIAVFSAVDITVISVLGAILFGAITSVSIVFITYLSAWFKARSAKRQININFNDAISHMYALTEGGAGIKKLIYQMADTEETTGKVAVEFQKVIDIIEYDSKNITTALQIQAQRTPSDKMSGLLSDLQTIQESGTEASAILESKHNDVMLDKDTNAKNAEATLELMNEVLLTSGLLPVFLVILMMVQGMMGSLPITTINLVTYGAAPIYASVLGLALFLMFQDESKSEKLMGTKRIFSESHAHIYNIPNILEDELKEKTRNKNHMTDSRLDSILKGLYKRDYRRENIYKPLLDIRDRPLAALPYSLILVILYGMVNYTILGIPPADVFTASPFEAYPYYILIPVTILLAPMLIIHTIVSSQREAIISKIPTILDTAINNMKTGETFEKSLQNVKTTSSSFNPWSGEEKIQKALDETWNNINWKDDRIYALRRMSNILKVPRMTQTMKIVTDSAEYTSDLVPVLEIESQNIEKYLEVKKIKESAGKMSAVILVVVALILFGILVVMDIMFIQQLQSVAGSAGGSGGELSGQSASMGFNPEVFGKLRAKFAHLSINMNFAFGLLAGFLHKQNFYTGLKYGIVLAWLTYALYGGVVLFV